MIHIVTILAATEHAAEESQGIAALGIDPTVILLQGITFIVFFMIVKKFAFTKIVKVLEERRLAIENSLDKAQELTRQNEAAQEQINELLRQARKDAENVIAKSHEEAGSIVEEATEAAEKKAKKIVTDGLAQIDQQVEKAQDELKKQTLELVAEATAALLSEKVDAKKNEVLIKKALSEVKS